MVYRWILAWTVIIWNGWTRPLCFFIDSIRDSRGTVVSKHNLAIVFHICRDWNRRNIFGLVIPDILGSLHLLLTESIIGIVTIWVILINLPNIFRCLRLWFFWYISGRIDYPTLHPVSITKSWLGIWWVDCSWLIGSSAQILVYFEFRILLRLFLFFKLDDLHLIASR